MDQREELRLLIRYTLKKHEVEELKGWAPPSHKKYAEGLKQLLEEFDNLTDEEILSISVQLTSFLHTGLDEMGLWVERFIALAPQIERELTELERRFKFKDFGDELAFYVIELRQQFQFFINPDAIWTKIVAFKESKYSLPEGYRELRSKLDEEEYQQSELGYTLGLVPEEHIQALRAMQDIKRRAKEASSKKGSSQVKKDLKKTLKDLKNKKLV